MSTTCVYHLKDYYNYRNNIQLDKSIIYNIQNIMSKLDVQSCYTNSITKTKHDDKRDKIRSKNKSNKFSIASNNSLSGLSKVIDVSESTSIIDKIRSNLNKLAPKNYEVIKNEILTDIDDALNDSELENDVYDVILSVLTTNDFYSEMYTDIYMLIAKRHEALNTKFNEYYRNYVDSFHDIIHVSPNDDYGEFCKQKKKNDRRCFFTKFIVNLIEKHNYDIDSEYLINIMSDVFFTKMDGARLDDLDELMVNVSLLYSNKKCQKEFEKKLVNYDLSFMDIFNNIVSKEYENINQKTYFKVMDLLEI